jgi:hypothetical protein
VRQSRSPRRKASTQCSAPKARKKPDGVRIVNRSTKFGNPHKVGQPRVPDRATAAAFYERDLLAGTLTRTQSTRVADHSGDDAGRTSRSRPGLRLPDRRQTVPRRRVVKICQPMSRKRRYIWDPGQFEEERRLIESLEAEMLVRKEDDATDRSERRSPLRAAAHIAIDLGDGVEWMPLRQGQLWATRRAH